MAPDADFNQDGDKRVQWFNIWKHSYLKTCAAIDQELEQHRKIDAFYSGTTALSIVKQVTCAVYILFWLVPLMDQTI